MNAPVPPRPIDAPPAPAARERPALAAWHAAWAFAAALTALIGLASGRMEGPALYGLIALAVPGLAGLGLLKHDGDGERMALTALWGLAAVIASALTGGLIGPLAGFVFMPLAAGLTLGGHRNATAGAVGTALAAPAGLLSLDLAGPAQASPGMAALSGLIVMAALVLGLRMAWRSRDARLEAAEATARRFDALLAAQPGLMLVLEPSGRVVAAYGAPPAGLSVDPLFADGLIPAVDARDRPAVLGALTRAANGLEGVAVFALREAPDRRVRLTLRRLDDPAGPRLVAQVQDATAEYAREVGLETARTEAEAREAGKTRFLANMSHELRTPLNAVLGFADIMRQRIFGPLPDRYAEYADSIHQAGGHLLELINDVLDVSKIEAERYVLAPERFDAREEIVSALALVRGAAQDKGVVLTPVLPDRTVEVTADRRALKQMMLNLLSNAVKFTPAGGVVTATLTAHGRDLELVVADTGLGIAPEDIDRLGRPFEQAGEADQRAQGTGLGLSLVRAFAELHGGTMTIESTLGEGTAVTVRMPVAEAPAATGGAEIIPLPRKNGS